MMDLIVGLEQNEKSVLCHSKCSNVSIWENNIPWVEIGTLYMKDKLVSVGEDELDILSLRYCPDIFLVVRACAETQDKGQCWR